MRRLEILKFSRRRVRCLDQHEQSPAGAHAGNEGRKRIAAKVGIDRDRVAGEIAVSEEGLGVGSRGDTDIAALGVSYSYEANRPSELEHFGKRAHTLESACLEERQLRLDRGNVRRARLDDLATKASEGVAGWNAGSGFRIELRIYSENRDRMFRALRGD